MPPLGHYGHLGQWAGGQSNCPPLPHGHYKHQGQWAAGYQGQWNNCCEGMATNHHGHANWDGLVVVVRVPYRPDGLMGLRRRNSNSRGKNACNQGGVAKTI